MRNFALFILLLSIPWQAYGQQPSSTQVKFFESKIRPALTKYCYECHSVEAGDSQGGLLLDTKQGMLQGGNGGPALVPGDAEGSMIWEAITWQGYEMPPSQKMPASVIADFKEWIEMGAPDPREREITNFTTKITEKDIENARREHWAFQAPSKRENEAIDSLVQKRLREEGLEASGRANGYTLLRRIYFDLVGLPPTPAEIGRFQDDFKKNPNAAIKQKIEQLMNTPQYGERWGRHWLDVARYAESSGSRNTPFPHAWRYRDYVIDSFNEDKPYDQFITEQIAGDLIPVETDEEWTENLVATGFLAIGLKHLDEKNPRVFLADMVDEQIDTTTQAILGLTVACARCHDHKYDPIPTDDYYRLAGIFQSTKTYYGTARIAQNHRPSDLLLLPVQEESNAGRDARQRVALLKAQLEQVDRQMRQAGNGKDRRSVRNNRNRIASQLASLNPDGSVKSFAMGVQEAERMVNANILFGGEVDKPAQQVERGFVQILGDLDFTSNARQSGRLQLANAMASKSNPLTARVMVNRVWMHLMGKPLVETASNFGLGGTEPSNQELLDLLAVQFMDYDWSIKRLIKEIMLSEAYLRSSEYDAENYRIDPDNKFCWRANPRHLDAEALRDAVLSVSGRLELERPERTPTVGTGVRERRLGESDTNRSVYLSIDRDSVPRALELFGFPDPSITSAGRSESIVPTQALYLMNDEFVIAQAQAMAGMLGKNFKDRDQQIRMAILWAYGRPATKEELVASKQFFVEYEAAARKSSDSNRVGASRGVGAAGRRDARGNAGSDATAEQFSTQQIRFYEQKIRPILASNCLSCHGNGRPKGGLKLSTRFDLLRGGDSGSVVDLDSPHSSLLMQVVESGSMPPKGNLDAAEIKLLEQWLRMKAPFSASLDASESRTNRRGVRGGPDGGAGARNGMRPGGGTRPGNGTRPGGGTRPGNGMRPGGGARRANGGGSNGGMRSAGQGRNPRSPSQAVGEQTPLSVFCQTLMASSGFRVLE